MTRTKPCLDCGKDIECPRNKKYCDSCAYTRSLNRYRAYNRSEKGKNRSQRFQQKLILHKTEPDEKIPSETTAIPEQRSSPVAANTSNNSSSAFHPFRKQEKSPPLQTVNRSPPLIEHSSETTVNNLKYTPPTSVVSHVEFKQLQNKTFVQPLPPISLLQKHTGPSMFDSRVPLEHHDPPYENKYHSYHETCPISHAQPQNGRLVYSDIQQYRPVSSPAANNYHAAYSPAQDWASHVYHRPSPSSHAFPSHMPVQHIRYPLSSYHHT